MNITELLTTPDGAVLAAIGGEVAKERPILFSGAMVRAILDGKKTQTRRVCKPYLQTVYSDHPDWRLQPNAAKTHCPYGTIGDRLWVRETWATGRVFKGDVQEYLYRATHTTSPPCVWRPSIFMPRAACRITLEITDVRVERVQDISEEDAIAEGIERFEYRRGELSPYVPMTRDEAREISTHAYGTQKLALGVMETKASAAYRRLWDSINAKRGHGWDLNPWAWVVSFRRVQP